MESLWNDQEAARFQSDLELRAYTSRLLGGEKSLVLYGGGNTSVKVRENGEEILYVKGSGADLAQVTEKDFAPVRLAAVQQLIGRDSMGNEEMIAQFRAALVRPEAPRPSIETILHAILPFKWVEHTHADAVLAVADTRRGEVHIRAAFGDSVLVVPYHHSGFELAKACHEIFTRRATPSTIGMVLLHHGIFAFGDSARESYQRMIGLVSRAEGYLKSRGAWDIPLRFPSATSLPLQGGGPGWGSNGGKTPIPTFPLTGGRSEDMLALAALRRDISLSAGFPLLMTVSSDLLSLAYARRPDLESLSQRGPATPQHAVFTKRVPLLGRDVAAFAEAYSRYLEENASAGSKHLPDPAPRIVLDPEWGMAAAGINAYYADAAAEIYRHSMRIQSRAEALEGYTSLPLREVLAAEIEYGGFEQAVRARYALAGQVALVDRALANQEKVEELLAQGAAVIGLDADPAVKTLRRRPDYLGLACEPGSRAEIDGALGQAVRRFGGIDLLFADNETLAAACRPLLELSPIKMLA